MVDRTTPDGWVPSVPTATKRCSTGQKEKRRTENCNVT
jgi:hypothetical protein